MFVGVATDAVTQTDGGGIGADGVEAVAIDDAVGGGEPEHSRFRITNLRTGGDAADLEDGDSGGKGEEGVDAFGVLVEAGRDGEGGFEVMAKELLVLVAGVSTMVVGLRMLYTPLRPFPASQDSRGPPAPAAAVQRRRDRARPSVRSREPSPRRHRGRPGLWARRCRCRSSAGPARPGICGWLTSCQ